MFSGLCLSSASTCQCCKIRRATGLICQQKIIIAAAAVNDDRDYDYYMLPQIDTDNTNTYALSGILGNYIAVTRMMIYYEFSYQQAGYT